MKMDFSGLPIIDAHVHAFMPSRELQPYGRVYSLVAHSLGPIPEVDVTSTLAYRMIMIELARLFDLPQDTPDEELVKLRAETGAKDYKAFVEMLCRDAGITTLLVETGFPVQGKRLQPEEAEVFENAVSSLRVKEIIRLESTCNHIMADAGEELRFDDFLNAFYNQVETKINSGNVVALKTVIGYFTGLEVRETTYEEAEASFYAYYYAHTKQKNFDRKKDRVIQKPFRDYMVLQLIELCHKYDLPLQIHTGAGDPPTCDLRLQNPVLLYELLNMELTRKINIVLLHGGYPYCQEMAFMVSGYRNVHTDVSSITCHDSIAIETMLPVLLQKVPFSKIMYGSDGAGDVDSVWFAAVNFKRVLARVLEDLVARNVLTYDYAVMAASWILSENAAKFYKLK